MKKTFNGYVTLLLSILTAIFSVSVSQAQTPPDLAWARTVVNSGVSSAEALAVDEQHNSYVAGSFNTSITVNGTTINHLNPGGGSSFYLIKYDQNGTGLWIKKTPFRVSKLLVHDDNLYIVGIYGQAAQHFDGIPFTVPSTTQGAYCLIKIGLDGTTQWVRTADHNGVMSAAFSSDISIFADQNNRIHMLGNFQTTINFQNGLNLINTESQAGGNAFHAIYDQSGSLVNVHKLGVINPSYTGSTDNEHFHVDFHNNVYRYVVSEDKLLKYDVQGNVLTEKNLTQTGAGMIHFASMSVDPFGGIFLAGYLYGGSVTIDGTLVTKHGDATRSDAVLLKLSASDGTIAWMDRYTYSACDDYKKVLTDAIGNAYVAGSKSMCIGGDVDMLFLKFTPDGERMWENNIVAGPPPFIGAPSGWTTLGTLTQAVNGGNIMVAGYFKERIQFDATTSFSGTSDWRAFVAQYGTCNTPTPVLTGNTTFCQGDSLQLSVTNNPGYSYMWNNGDTTAAIYVNTPGHYWVTVVEDDECYAGSEVLEVTENEFPDATVTLSGGMLTAVEGYSYQWLDCNNSNAPITGAVGSTFTPLQNGSYSVVVTSQQGCTATSSCYLLSNVGVEEQETKKLTMYPNPASESVRISNVPKYARITVRDMTGRIVFENPKTKETETIGLTSFRNGVYLVEINSDGTTRTEKLIVNK